MKLFRPPRRRARLAPLAACAACLLVSAYGSVARAVTDPFTWKGYTWTPTSGGMAGVANGDPANVSVDANGYLHLTIVKNGSTWTASEVFTTTSLGFGTYQWQIQGPIDRMDHTVVLGLFPYGPQAGVGADGTNEIDTEFSFWNDEVPNINADFGVYPPSASAKHWEDDFMFSLSGGDAATTRMEWSSKGIKSTLMSGYQSIGTTANVLKTDDYQPSNPNSDIPQQAVPLGMNLWCYNGFPSSGRNVEVVIRDFQFVPEGQPIAGDDAGAEGGAGDDGGAGPPDAGEGDGSPVWMPDAGGGSGSSGSGSGGSSGSGSGGAGSGSGAGSTSSGGSSGAAASSGSGGGSGAGSGSSGAASGSSSGSGAGSGGGSGGAGEGAAPGSSAKDASGCSCRAAGDGGAGARVPLAWAAVGALVGAALARRRRRSA